MDNADYQLLNKRSGFLGELLTQSVLRNLDSSYTVINSVRLSLGRVSQSTELDHLVISDSGIFTIDSKHWTGQIEFLNPGFVNIKPSGRVYSAGIEKDFTAQIQHQTNVLEQALISLGMVDIPIFGVVCFTEPSSRLVNELPKFKALLLKDLLGYIQSPRDKVLSSEVKSRVKDFILSNSSDSDTYSEDLKAFMKEKLSHSGIASRIEVESSSSTTESSLGRSKVNPSANWGTWSTRGSNNSDDGSVRIVTDGFHKDSKPITTNGYKVGKESSYTSSSNRGIKSKGKEKSNVVLFDKSSQFVRKESNVYQLKNGYRPKKKSSSSFDVKLIRVWNILAVISVVIFLVTVINEFIHI